jgi:hypothetical protein
MSLQDQLAADLATICADPHGAAIAATYTPQGGGPGMPVRIVFERTGAMEADGSDGKTMVGSALAYIPVATVPVVHLFDKLAVPAVGTPDWEVWSIANIREQNAALHVVDLAYLERTRLVGAEDERKRK